MATSALTTSHVHAVPEIRRITGVRRGVHRRKGARERERELNAERFRLRLL